MTNTFEDVKIARLLQLDALNASTNVKLPILNLPANIPGSMSMLPGGPGIGQPQIRRTDGSIWTASGGGCSLPILSMIVFVNKAGNDSTGDGSACKPYLTIGVGMASILDASPSKRYQLAVGPGTYAESVTLKANVFISGAAPVMVRINDLNINDPSWTPNTDNRSGLVHVQILNTGTFNFVANQGQQGKLYLFQCRFSDVDYTGCNSINQMFLYNCEFLGNLVHQGGDVYWYSSVSLGNITIFDQVADVNPVAGQIVDTRFFSSGGGNLLGGSFTVSNTIVPITYPLINHTILVNFIGFATSGTLTIIGGGMAGDTQVFSTADGVPSAANLTITSTGTLTLMTFANAIGYVPSVLANWSGVPPVDVQNALDRIAAKIGPIS